MTKNITKAREAKATKEKLMLNPSQSLLNSKQLLHILQKTPKHHIYRRPARGGGEWEYVTSTYVKKVLNYVFGWMWDFEIKEHGKEGKLVWVLGRLIVKDKNGNPKIVKEQFGRAEIKTKKNTDIHLDFGNDLKAAASDALKKCASELGIASDIYGKQEFKEIEVKSNDKKASEQSTAGNVLASQQDNKMIEALCRKLKINDPEKAYEYIKKLTGINFNNKLTKNDTMTIITKLMEKANAKKRN